MSKYFMCPVTIQAKAGKGGDGSGSYVLTGKYKRKYDGGCGGSGADIVLIGDRNVDSFSKHLIHLKGAAGGNGEGNNRTGKSMPALQLRVPLNVSIKYDNDIVGIITQHDQKFIVCSGGQGGVGSSVRLKTDKRKGLPGEKFEITAIHILQAYIAVLGEKIEDKRKHFLSLTESSEDLSSPFTEIYRGKTKDKRSIVWIPHILSRKAEKHIGHHLKSIDEFHIISDRPEDFLPLLREVEEKKICVIRGKDPSYYED